MGYSITVGIPTDGKPRLRREGELTVVENMLIGKDFHWQRPIEARLPGSIELRDNEEFPVINRLPLETYLRCVVGSEMNPEAPEEFLKAHAVISRSWAMGKILGVHSCSEEGKTDAPDRFIDWEDTCDHTGFDVCSDDHCQRYQGVQPIPESVAEALKATDGEVLLSPSGTLVDARFSKCCGGRTEVFSTCWQPREEACLESFEDPWCNLDSLSVEDRANLLRMILKDYDLDNGGGFRWKTDVSSDEIRLYLREKFGRDIGEIVRMEAVERGPSGRIKTLKLTGTGMSEERPLTESPTSGYSSPAELVIGKELMIRRLLAPTHLYSSQFDIEETGQGRWRLSGHGWGHGVGLCQIGAANMARHGFSYHRILEFYYPGSTVGKAMLSFLIAFLLSIFSSCAGKKDSGNSTDPASFSISSSADSSRDYGGGARFSIFDGEREHLQPLTPEERDYHASRGVSTLEEAYLEGYDDGCEDGEKDGTEGVDFGLSFNPDDHSFSGRFAESYVAGYEDGYHDGYHTNYKIYRKSERISTHDESDDADTD